MDALRKIMKDVIAAQLAGRRRFNMIAFHADLLPWQSDDVGPIYADDAAVKSAYRWLDGLHARNSTNTLAALTAALASAHVEHVYLLSDGRPDDEPAVVLETLAKLCDMRSVVIHTISFNCCDKEANHILADMASNHKGSFQYYLKMLDLDNEALLQPETIAMLGPFPRSLDERLNALRSEILFARGEIKKVHQLYLECAEFVRPPAITADRIPSTTESLRSSSGLYSIFPSEPDVDPFGRGAWNKYSQTRTESGLPALPSTSRPAALTTSLISAVSLSATPQLEYSLQMSRTTSTHTRPIPAQEGKLPSSYNLPETVNVPQGTETVQEFSRSMHTELTSRGTEVTSWTEDSEPRVEGLLLDQASPALDSLQVSSVNQTQAQDIHLSHTGESLLDLSSISMVMEADAYSAPNETLRESLPPTTRSFGTLRESLLPTTRSFGTLRETLLPTTRSFDSESLTHSLTGLDSKPPFYPAGVTSTTTGYLSRLVTTNSSTGTTGGANKKTLSVKDRLRAEHTRLRSLLTSAPLEEKIPSSDWLAHFGMAALKLTIFDLFASTAFPHLREYVASLKKVVPSQVHDAMFPYYQITDSKGKVWHINPLYADLPAYIKTLTIAHALYQRRLDVIVLLAMDKGWRTELSSGHPLEHDEIQARFIDSNKNLSLDLMAREVRQAAIFLAQAKEIHASLHRIPPPPVMEQPRLSVTYNPRDLELSLTARPMPSMTPLNSLPLPVMLRTETATRQLSSPKTGPSQSWHTHTAIAVGEVVVARHPSAKYYAGQVLDVSHQGVEVEFHNSRGVAVVPHTQVFSLSRQNTQASILKLSDCVLACGGLSDGEFLPGTVIGLVVDYQARETIVSLRTCDGFESEFRREYVVKIPRALHDLLFRALQDDLAATIASLTSLRSPALSSQGT